MLVTSKGLFLTSLNKRRAMLLIISFVESIWACSLPTPNDAKINKAHFCWKIKMFKTVVTLPLIAINDLLKMKDICYEYLWCIKLFFSDKNTSIAHSSNDINAGDEAVAGFASKQLSKGFKRYNLKIDLENIEIKISKILANVITNLPYRYSFIIWMQPFPSRYVYFSFCII